MSARPYIPVAAGIMVMAVTVTMGWWEMGLQWIDPVLVDMDARLQTIQNDLRALPAPKAEVGSIRLGFYTGPLAPRGTAPWIRLDLGDSIGVDAIVLIPASKPYRSFPGPGFGFPKRLKVELACDPDFHDAVALPHPPVSAPGVPVMLPAGGQTARWVRVTALEPWTFEDHAAFALGELMVLSGLRNVAVMRPVEALDASQSLESPPEWALENLVDGQSLIGAPTGHLVSDAMGYRGRPTPESIIVKWVQLDLGRSRPIEEIRLVPAMAGAVAGQRESFFPRRFRVAISDDPNFIAATTIFTETSPSGFRDPAQSPVTLPANGVRGRYVRLTATHFHGLEGLYRLTLAEMQIYAEGENITRDAVATCLDSDESPPAWGIRHLTDHIADGRTLMEWPAYIDQIVRRENLVAAYAALKNARQDRLDRTRDVALSLLVGLSLIGLGTGGWMWRQRIILHRQLAGLRDRILRDMHDDLGSGLGTIALLSQITQRQPGLPTETRADLAEINQLARELNDSIRDMAWLAREEVAPTQSLAERFRDLAHTLLPGLECRVEAPDDIPYERLPLADRRELLLFVKEAFHNIVKHAHAQKVILRIDTTRDHIRFTITDNGAGFEASRESAGNGLRSLRHRAEIMRGTLTIQSRPGAGTGITLEIPRS